MDTATGLWVPCAKTKDLSCVAENLQKDKHFKFRVK